ncbi:MAG TPA: GNAT family N-acetyltransferase, partial [Acidimicrobiia bacterium]|nr:GNAT family N-acetyltransferase [Acidimicrobiia bacterium]
MSAARNPWPAADIHVEWGVPGVEQAVARGDGVVVVDVMSFSTVVTLLTQRGATVRGLAPDDIATLGGRDAVAERLGAHVAGENRGDPSARFTLSPASASRVSAGDRLVLPSPNGGRLTTACAGAPFAVVGSLRNCAAVGEFVAVARRLELVERVTIVAAAEQWKADWTGADRSRFALEDWLGAGAIASEARNLGVHLSAEAETAARAFASARADLDALLAESLSGRELRDAGFAEDVVLASEVAVDPGVPCLGADGFVARLPFAVRPATEGDRTYLFTLKQATMREYIADAFGGWDEREQRTMFDPDLARTAIVSVDGRAAGMIEARRDRGGIYLANIEVDPEYQSIGLGARLVGLLATAAHAHDLPLVLQVLKTNPRARRFYERVGLRVTG